MTSHIECRITALEAERLMSRPKTPGDCFFGLLEGVTDGHAEDVGLVALQVVAEVDGGVPRDERIDRVRPPIVLAERLVRVVQARRPGLREVIPEGGLEP